MDDAAGRNGSRDGAGEGVQPVPGARLGLPAAGPGSVAGWGRRVVALGIDWVLASVVGSTFLAGTLGPQLAPLPVFFLLHVLLVSTIGMTVGQAVAGLAVRRVDAPVPVGFGRGVPRAVLVLLVVPPLVWDADRRGLHDKAADTIVVRR